MIYLHHPQVREFYEATTTTDVRIVANGYQGPISGITPAGVEAAENAGYIKKKTPPILTGAPGAQAPAPTADPAPAPPPAKPRRKGKR